MIDEKIWAFKPHAGAAPRLRIPDLGALVIRLFDLLYAWHQHMRDRHQLLSLSDHALKDIGISRATAEHAADEPFWAERR
jgi:uncharacterized protein YjiS (DUF1127 family)